MIIKKAKFLLSQSEFKSFPQQGMQEIAMAVFTAVVQGILVAGLSTYVNQVGKQLKKEE